MSIRPSAIVSALAGFFALTAAGGAAAVAITTVGQFDGYTGPVGAPINVGTPPTVDPFYGPSLFSNGTTAVDVSPQNPYAGYSWPEFTGAGTATQAFTGGWGLVEFSNQFVGGGGETLNRLEIAGTTNPAVTLGDLFHMATPLVYQR